MKEIKNIGDNKEKVKEFIEKEKNKKKTSELSRSSKALRKEALSIIE